MRAPAHHGVVLVFSNEGRSHFLLQRKDASYPHFPRCYSFFGGALESGEETLEGLERELMEEFPESIRPLLVKPRRPLFDGWIETPEFRFQINLFESTLSDEELRRIAASEVLEGESADLVEREKLSELSFVWGLEQLVPVILSKA